MLTITVIVITLAVALLVSARAVLVTVAAGHIAQFTSGPCLPFRVNSIRPEALVISHDTALFLVIEERAERRHGRIDARIDHVQHLIERM